jgi:hypothetical protein
MLSAFQKSKHLSRVCFVMRLSQRPAIAGDNSVCAHDKPILDITASCLRFVHSVAQGAVFRRVVL